MTILSRREWVCNEESSSGACSSFEDAERMFSFVERISDTQIYVLTGRFVQELDGTYKDSSVSTVYTVECDEPRGTQHD